MSELKTRNKDTATTGQIALVFCGLPARGKTHVSRSISRYLRWIGVRARVFSLGDMRRALIGSATELPTDYFEYGSHSAESREMRLRVKSALENKMINELKSDKIQVAIYDATNGEKEERLQLKSKLEALGVYVMFIENICQDDNLVNMNMRRVKISSPDYRGLDAQEALKLYKMRVDIASGAFETLANEEAPFIKYIDSGERLVLHHINGYLQTRMTFYLMNIHAHERTIWLAHTGESWIDDSYKADADLSMQGKRYAQKLADCISKARNKMKMVHDGVLPGNSNNTSQSTGMPNLRPTEKLTIFSSTRRRCLSTAAPLYKKGHELFVRSQLSELNPGVIDGLTQEDIRHLYPDEWEKAQQYPYSHRYPRAESYHDLTIRLEPVIMEVERVKNDIVIIGHASVLRCFLAYLCNMAPSSIPSIEIPRGQLFRVCPQAYGVDVRRYTFWHETSSAPRGISASPSVAHSPVLEPIHNTAADGEIAPIALQGVK